MSVFGIAMVRDEADIIRQTVGHMCEQVDHVIVADNGSTDGTREILEELDVEVIDDPDPAYYQSAKMSKLAKRAAAGGASWVVPFDSDEWWYSNHGHIADQLAGGAISPATVYDHVATAIDEGDDPISRMGWRRRKELPLHKVACRTARPVTIWQGNHGASYGEADLVDAGLIVRHFPYRSPEQMIRKARNGAAAYAATDLPEDVGAHWRGYGRLSDGEIERVFHEFYFSEDPERDPKLTFDPAP